jgi:hypothetical protein
VAGRSRRAGEEESRGNWGNREVEDWLDLGRLIEVAWDQKGGGRIAGRRGGGEGKNLGV